MHFYAPCVFSDIHAFLTNQALRLQNSHFSDYVYMNIFVFFSQAINRINEIAVHIKKDNPV